MYTLALKYNPHLGRAMAFFAGLTALAVFLYGIFLLEAVGNTAQRTAAERQIRNLTSKVSQLEEAYLVKTREMTLSRAEAMGFVAPTKVTTVFATAGATSLSAR
jgi:hypothetical protein